MKKKWNKEIMWVQGKKPNKSSIIHTKCKKVLSHYKPFGYCPEEELGKTLLKNHVC